MSKPIVKKEILKTPADIWKKFIQRGNIQESYDQELIDLLKHRFGVKESEDFLAYLKRSSITNEEFLLAFFQEMSPYTTMYKDLLVMFEKANARCTDRNLKIEFDFGAGNEFDFSIEEFSQYTNFGKYWSCLFGKNGMNYMLPGYLQGYWGHFLIPQLSLTLWMENFHTLLAARRLLRSRWQETLFTCGLSCEPDLI